MRILFLCHRVPYPPDKGDKIRAFHLLRALAQQHEVDLFTLADDPADLAYREPLRAYCNRISVARLNRRWARLRSLPFLATSKPLTLPYFWSAELGREVRKALEERSYDRIVVYSSAMAQYIDSEAGIPLFLDLVDVDSDKWVQYAAYTQFPLSAIYRHEGRCLREYERKVCKRAQRVFVCTHREAELARRIAPESCVEVIPNGVDTDYFNPAGIVPADQPAVIFTGDMSYYPNERAVEFFARDVLPLIRGQVPNVGFLIVGRNPTPRVRALNKVEGVTVTGYVPDVRTYLAQAQVAVAPFSIAAGIPNKLLEAISWGLPVIATPRAVQGLVPEVAELVETAEGIDPLARGVVRLLKDESRRREVGLEGRRRVIKAYNWARFSAQVLEAIESTGTGNSAKVTCAPASGALS